MEFNRKRSFQQEEDESIRKLHTLIPLHMKNQIINYVQGNNIIRPTRKPLVPYEATGTSDESDSEHNSSHLNKKVSSTCSIVPPPIFQKDGRLTPKSINVSVVQNNRKGLPVNSNSASASSSSIDVSPINNWMKWDNATHENMAPVNRKIESTVPVKRRVVENMAPVKRKVKNMTPVRMRKIENMVPVKRKADVSNRSSSNRSSSNRSNSSSSSSSSSNSGSSSSDSDDDYNVNTKFENSRKQQKTLKCNYEKPENLKSGLKAHAYRRSFPLTFAETKSSSSSVSSSSSTDNTFKRHSTEGRVPLRPQKSMTVNMSGCCDETTEDDDEEGCDNGGGDTGGNKSLMSKVVTMSRRSASAIDLSKSRLASSVRLADNNRRRHSSYHEERYSPRIKRIKIEENKWATRPPPLPSNLVKNVLESRYQILKPYDMKSLESVPPLYKYIDSHCHLDFLFKRLQFEGTHNEYIEENRRDYPRNYGGCVAIFCNPLTFSEVDMWKQLIDEDGVWAAFGCHPHFADLYNDDVENHLKSALKHPKVKALGEIGLDYSNRNNCNKDTQKIVFEKQLKIATKLNLPIVIHSRDATKDSLEIMKKIVPKNYLIHRHCFTGSWKEAETWMQVYPSLYIGLTALVTFPSASNVHEVAKRIPLDRLLIETDSPYFLPRNEPPNRRWSNPGMAAHVAAQIASIRNKPLSEIMRQTYRNTRFMYRI